MVFVILFLVDLHCLKSVEVPEDVNLSLSDFVNTSYAWDKKALKKELDKGISYEEYGISLVEKESLSVR